LDKAIQPKDEDEVAEPPPSGLETMDSLEAHLHLGSFKKRVTIEGFMSWA